MKISGLLEVAAVPGRAVIWTVIQKLWHCKLWREIKGVTAA